MPGLQNMNNKNHKALLELIFDGMFEILTNEFLIRAVMSSIIDYGHVNLHFLSGHIDKETSMRIDLELDEAALRKKYKKPVEKEENRINLVLFVASALEEAPTNLLDSLREASRNDYRGTCTPVSYK